MLSIRTSDSSKNTVVSCVQRNLNPYRGVRENPSGSLNRRIALMVAKPIHFLSIIAIVAVRFLTLSNRAVLSLIGVKPGEKGAVSTSIKEGGDQIEYEDQDPRIHHIWLEEMKKHNVEPKMQRYFPGPNS